MPKKKKYQKKSFESTGKPSDTSANIYRSMRMSGAWLALTKSQRELYGCCRDQYYGEKDKPYRNPEAFTMNQKKWRDTYKLYTCKSSFYKDMTALIEKGFIKCIECGANTRTKSIYAYSDKWQWYGTPHFEILPSEITNAMRNRIKKKENKGEENEENRNKI